MLPSDFDYTQFERGKKYTFGLDLGPTLNGMPLPVLLARGERAGKVLVVTAGVHGDEYEGVRTILDVFAALSPADMSGDFLAVPVANPPAFWSGSRTSPLDGKNLARVFPGSADGSPSDITAHILANSIIAQGDFYLDLHSAGVKLLMPTMAGYYASDPRAEAAARIFGARVLWAHPTVSQGRTVSFAESRGIPWIYTEARGGGRIDPEDLCVFSDGINNLLRHLSIVPGEVETYPPDFHLYGDGDVDESLISHNEGILMPTVKLLQQVLQGEELGRITDLHGNILEVIIAPRRGIVALVRQCITVDPGDATFLITGTISDR